MTDGVMSELGGGDGRHLLSDPGEVRDAHGASSDRALTISVVCSIVRALRPGSAPAVGRTVISTQFDTPSVAACQVRAPWPGISRPAAPERLAGLEVREDPAAFLS